MTAGGTSSFASLLGRHSDPKFLPALERLGFQKPTVVQTAALPKAMAGESFRALAPTGTGKTLVYLLPIWALQLQRHANSAASRGKKPVGKHAAARAATEPSASLVLLPTRELAYQVSQMLQDLDPDLRDGLALAIGGHAKDSQMRMLAGGWDTLIATPGRLLDLMASKAVSLAGVRLLVLDEFDKLLGMGFAEQLSLILRQVPEDSQKLLFSATDPEENATDASMPPGLGSLQGLARLSVDREAGTRVMEEAFFLLKTDRKKGDLLLAELARTKGQAIVFVGNREKANHLHGLLKIKGVTSLILHGHLPQADRAAAYRDFREGGFRVLVATDLASRGLDMPAVDLIVNYDLPKHFKDYVHRTGRAARRGRAGRTASFAGPQEYIPMRNLEKEFPVVIPFAEGFDHRDPWFRDAKRIHDQKVKLEEKRESIRKQQGLDPK